MFPSKLIYFHTPFECLFNKTPDYTTLRVFGCACWPNLRPYNTRKLSFRSKQCVFIGYCAMLKALKCLDVQTGRVYISRDVVSDETIFYISTSSTKCRSSTSQRNFTFSWAVASFWPWEDNNRFHRLLNSHTTNYVPSGEFTAENAENTWNQHRILI
jgi:hypothetical protein